MCLPRWVVNPIISNTMAVFSGDKIRLLPEHACQGIAGKMRFIQFYAEVVNGGNSDAVDKYGCRGHGGYTSSFLPGPRQELKE